MSAAIVALVLVGSIAPMALALSPTTTMAVPGATADASHAGLLPGVGLETRSIAPGIVRVVGDGTGRSLDDLKTLFIGQDGSVWLSRPDRRRVFRLGVPGSSPPLPRTLNRYTFSIADSGDLRADNHLDGLLELRGGRWVEIDPDTDTPYPAHPEASEWTPPFQASDGSWWFGLADVTVPEVLRYTSDGAWERLSIPGAQATAWQFIETADGTIWATAGSGGIGSALYSFDGKQWEPVEVLDDGTDFDAGSLRLDDDGGLVVSGYAFYRRPPDHLEATRTGTGWAVEPIPDLWEEFPLLFKADLEPLGEDGTGWAIGEDGKYLVWFDGENARRLDVPSRRVSVRPRIEDYQVAADGSIWIIVRDVRRKEDRVTGDGLYVITPEAVLPRPSS